MSVAAQFSDEIKATYSKAVRNQLIRISREAYIKIMQQWPIYSGYSKANNRISITGRDIQRIQPSQRIARPNAHLAKAQSTRVAELAKLSRIRVEFGKRTRRIIIGNAVYYAADAGGSGRGVAIYESAARQANAVGNTE